jgi:16S rRNA (cytosine1407-C5)-methyltransferase
LYIFFRVRSTLKKIYKYPYKDWMSKKTESKKIEVAPQAAALERLMALLPAEELPLLLAELERPLHSALRVNPFKAQAGAVEQWAQRYGWQLQPVPFCDAGWWLLAAQTALSQTIEHRLGHYYIQDAASMLPVELFDWDNLEDPLVLDLAASPGGKTTHLLAKTGDRGLVLANDSSSDRITALRLVLQNWGGLHMAVTNFHGEKFGGWFPDTFDRVLIDAPCSMQGLRSSEAHPMRAITEKERTALAQRQFHLLESALRAAKPGGQVVYSTCTLEPEEDEGVLDRLLRTRPAEFRIDNLERRLVNPAPGLTEAFGQVFAPEVNQAVRLWPHRYATAGFFAARLTKLEPTNGESMPYPGRPIGRAGWEPLRHKSLAWLTGAYQEAYEVDLTSLLETHELEVWRREKGLYAFPATFFQRFGDLPVQGLGLLLGEDGLDGFEPSHEWVARFGVGFKSGRYPLPAEHLAGWLRGEDIPGAPGRELPPGRIVAVFDEEGRLLGRGKVQVNRLKNLLPKRLF